MAVSRHVLIVAGSDSSGGAGIARDIETIVALGLPACLAVTAITVQTHAKVSQVQPVEAALIEAQMRAALAANRVAAIKIGMLGALAAVEAVARVLADHRHVPVVLDPVLAASSGRALLYMGAVVALVETLMPACTLITPNLPELALLTGQTVAQNEDMSGAQGMLLLERIASPRVPSLPTPAKSEDPEVSPAPPPPCGKRLEVGVPALNPSGPAILVKGGHASGDEAIDLLLRPGAPTLHISAPRLDLRMRGTGCMLSSAIAGNLAKGAALPEAVTHAKQMVFERLASTART